MMNIGPDAAAALSMWEYEALLFYWNEAHATDDGEAPAPDPEVAMAILDLANRNPLLTQ